MYDEGIEEHIIDEQWAAYLKTVALCEDDARIRNNSGIWLFLDALL